MDQPVIGLGIEPMAQRERALQPRREESAFDMRRGVAAQEARGDQRVRVESSPCRASCRWRWSARRGCRAAAPSPPHPSRSRWNRPRDGPKRRACRGRAAGEGSGARCRSSPVLEGNCHLGQSPRKLRRRSSITTESFVSHSQITRTRYPIRLSLAKSRLSRSLLRRSFGTQYSRFRLGIRARRHR